jgi:hypothetical protein
VAEQDRVIREMRLVVSAQMAQITFEAGERLAKPRGKRRGFWQHGGDAQ